MTRIDHRHCPSTNSPCGIEGEHRCCLCERECSTTPRIEEIVKEFSNALFVDHEDNVEHLDLGTGTEAKAWLRQALTQAHQAGIDKAVEEKIVCSAVRFNDKVWMGHRHAHSLKAMRDELSYTMNRKEMNEQQTDRDQGFITNTGRYVGREKAWDIAEKAGQLNERKNKTLGYLYSEDVW